jgi:hypothetical protein
MMKKNIKRMALAWLVLTYTALVMPISAKKADSTYVMPQHSVFLEIGGASDFVGLNYDMRLKKASRWGFRVGASWAYDSDEFTLNVQKEHLIGLSTDGNYLIGGRRNHLELGIGNKLLLIKFCGHYYHFPEDNSDEPLAYQVHKTWVRDLLYLNIGYRHEALHGFQFRCGITPMINVAKSWQWADGSKTSNGDISLAPYVSFGWAF